jgi:hypothetical protein
LTPFVDVHVACYHTDTNVWCNKAILKVNKHFWNVPWHWRPCFIRP